MFRFNLRYALLSVLLLGIEIFIGACLHDSIIRPYGGDFLVVILLYCMDILSYTLGIASVILLEKVVCRKVKMQLP
jgi:hypothetical protein